MTILISMGVLSILLPNKEQWAGKIDHTAMLKELRPAFLPAPSQEQISQVVRQIEALLNPVDYAAFMGRVTNFGMNPGRAPWYWTSKYLRQIKHPDPQSFSKVIHLFGSLGCKNDVQAAVFIVANDKHDQT